MEDSQKNRKLWLILPIILTIAIISFNVVTLLKNTSTNQHKLMSWGYNAFGQLGSEVLTQQTKDIQSVKALDRAFKDISTGLHHSIALDMEGRVWSWGNNKFGQLGDGNEGNQKGIPSEIKNLNNIKQISAGQHHNLALDNDGFVWTWGHNLSGELGTGDHINRKEPVKLENFTNIKALSAGYRFSIALKDDGTLLGWGGLCKPSNQDEFKKFIDLLAQNTTLEGGYTDANGGDISNINEYNDCLGEDYLNIKANTPTLIPNIDNVKEASAGFGHILALKNDGTVWSMGCNKYGQIGNGIVANTQENKSFKKVQGLESIKHISAGYRHSMALSNKGTLFSWGHNLNGELGIGDIGNTPEPVKTKDIPNIDKIDAGHDYSIASDTSGNIWGWGDNNYSVIGEKKEEQKHILTPTKITTIKEIQKISAGGGHILVLKK